MLRVFLFRRQVFVFLQNADGVCEDTFPGVRVTITHEFLSVSFWLEIIADTVLLSYTYENIVRNIVRNLYPFDLAKTG